MSVIEQGKAVVVVLLDLSIYLWHSSSWYPFTHITYPFRHQWSSSWLVPIISFRQKTGVSSSTRDLKYGVPQGSVWGPFLFSVNLLPLRKIITDHGVSYELYVVHCQLYIVFNHSEGDIANIALGSVISDTLHWLTMNFQKVNDGKAEMMLISSMHLLPVEFRQFLLGYEIIMPADSFRNLGV